MCVCVEVDASKNLVEEFDLLGDKGHSDKGPFPATL